MHKGLLPAFLMLMNAPLANAIVILHTTYETNGGTIDPPDHANVDLGYSAHSALASQEAFRGVVETGNCSATWIGNSGGTSYFMTAAHCLGGAPNGSTSIGFAYTDWQGNSFNLSTASVTSWHHPDWNSGTYAYDIAILGVDTTITIPGASQPLIYGGTAETGELITMVGHGIRGVGGGSGTTGQSLALYGEARAAGQNLIDRVGPNEITGTGAVIQFDFDAPANAINELESHIASGDSGGSGWIQINGQWMLAGVSSLSGIETYGNSNLMTRVSATTPWILSTFSAAQIAVPEPSTSLYFVISIAAIITIRRR